MFENEFKTFLDAWKSSVASGKLDNCGLLDPNRARREIWIDGRTGREFSCEQEGLTTGSQDDKELEWLRGCSSDMVRIGLLNTLQCQPFFGYYFEMVVNLL